MLFGTKTKTWKNRVQSGFEASLKEKGRSTYSNPNGVILERMMRSNVPPQPAILNRRPSSLGERHQSRFLSLVLVRKKEKDTPPPVSTGEKQGNTNTVTKILITKGNMPYDGNLEQKPHLVEFFIKPASYDPGRILVFIDQAWWGETRGGGLEQKGTQNWHIPKGYIHIWFIYVRKEKAAEKEEKRREGKRASNGSSIPAPLHKQDDAVASKGRTRAHSELKYFFFEKTSCFFSSIFNFRNARRASQLQEE